MLRDKYGRQINHFALYPLLGFKHGQHLPKEGFGPRVVVDEQGNESLLKCEPASGAYAKHRIFYECESCKRWIPYGRANQHRNGREHKLNYEVRAGRP